MPKLVVMGAMMQCPFGTTPSKLVVTSQKEVLSNGMLAATIMDFAPMSNIPPFGMCITPVNPQVAAATAAAMGVLTPQPCIPATVAPWSPGSPTHTINNLPVLNDVSKCMCSWTGLITITMPGQMAEDIP